MAMNNSSDDDRFVDERLKALDRGAPARIDEVRARSRLQGRLDAQARWTRPLVMAGLVVVTTILVLLTLPEPRAAAQRLWDRLTLHRVEVVQVARRDLPDPKGLFEGKDEYDQPIPVSDAAEAERIAGFRPLLPSADVLSGAPQLSVVKHASISYTVKVADLERALAAAGIADVKVPRQWDGVTMRVEMGPTIRAMYGDGKMGLSQSPPYKLVTPAGFPVGRFMETIYRVLGKSAADARDLSRKFVANPAWMLVFPGHDTVREMPLKSGRAVSAGGCFFWNTPDRLFVIGAENMDPDVRVAVANSLR
jgi:hypothetical protein